MKHLWSWIGEIMEPKIAYANKLPPYQDSLECYDLERIYPKKTHFHDLLNKTINYIKNGTMNGANQSEITIMLVVKPVLNC